MRVALCGICGLALLVAGCGGTSGGPGAGQASRSNASLMDVGELYRIYTLTNKKPPESLKDLAPLQNAGPNGFGALKTGEIVVRYGATMADTEEGPSKTSSDEILAYEKTVPESGGAVLMLDRTMKTMTAEEFKAGKKAGKG